MNKPNGSRYFLPILVNNTSVFKLVKFQSAFNLHVRERTLCTSVSFFHSSFLHRLCQQNDEGSKVTPVCMSYKSEILFFFFFTYLAYTLEGNTNKLL